MTDDRRRIIEHILAIAETGAGSETVWELRNWLDAIARRCRRALAELGDEQSSEEDA